MKNIKRRDNTPKYDLRSLAGKHTVKGQFGLGKIGPVTGHFLQGSVQPDTKIGHVTDVDSLMSHINAADLHTIAASDKIGMIKEGVSKKTLQEIKDDSELDYDALSIMLSVSRATLINKKPKERFDQSTSEKIMLLAEVMSYGKEVFEDKDVFNKWLRKSNKALGNQTPVAMMDTLYGIQEVKNELGRIEYGIF